MAQNLRGNLELTCSSFIRNLDICLNQAKEVQRVNALAAAKHRHSDHELADWHFQGFDEASAVMEWVDEIKLVLVRCPQVRDDKGRNGTGEKHASPALPSEELRESMAEPT